MFFFKKKSLKTQPNQPNSAGPEQVTVPETDTAEVTKVTEAPAAPTNTTGVFGRMFFRNQKFSGPETSYENEAWAPETESVGLFRKHRAIVEEQVSSSSGPQ